MTDAPIPRSKTITLHEEIKHGEKFVDEIELRCPKYGEVKRALAAGKKARNENDEESVAIIASLIESVTGLSRPAVESIGFDQFTEAGEYLMGFFNKTPGSPTAD